jgi:hypothetical protein
VQHGNRRTAEDVFEVARKSEPDVTLPQIKQRLEAATAAGLIRCYNRNKISYLRYDERVPVKGVITLQLDDGPLYHCWVEQEQREAPLALNRFGIFNFQLYHESTEFYLSDLVINGQPIGLSRDPQWEGKGNRVSFVEHDFQRQNFGYSATNWAGKAAGEIGGFFSRTEGIDPGHGYYADDVGAITLDDPFSFSGSICFVNGGTDAGMFFGYFNAAEKMKTFTDTRGASPLNDQMGIDVSGPTHAGYYFSALCSPKAKVASVKKGPVFLPTQDCHAFAVSYDPRANDGIGRMTVTLDKKTFALDPTPAQRAAGAKFDRFGIMNVRKGGKYVTMYLDDLSYTARRGSDYQPPHRTQEIVKLPYPADGRQY